MSTPQSTVDLIPAAGEHAPEAGIDLFAVLVAILSEWRLALITFVLVSLCCFAYIYTLKPQYVATSSFLPQEGRSGSGTLQSIFATHGPGALYVGLLHSRTVQDNVIAHENLLQQFHTTSVESARGALAGKSSFSEGGDTIVTITVRDGDAQEAARIANAYLVALQELNDTMSLQQGTQTTQFFEHQLQQEREQLNKSETDLARTETQTGLIAPETQTQLGLSAIAGTRDQISTLRTKIAGLLQSETEQNPEVQRLRNQEAELEAHERSLEGSGGSPVGAAPPASQMPRNNLDIIRAQREVKYHDILVSSLANQFETAKLNEAFTRSAFQIVDSAVAPEHKAWPPRAPFLLISLVFAALAGLAAIAAKLTWARIAANPNHQAQLSQLYRAFGLHSSGSSSSGSRSTGPR